MSIITEDFLENPYTRMLNELYPRGLAEATLEGENPYRQMLREACAIPNPYKPEPACREQAVKDEFIPNPYRHDEKNIAPQSSNRGRRVNVFHIPNPYR
ncbi:MAG TPA: hypothetical protein VJR29_07215 [bacterium]|nr:hypothetical protein [bacterium]